MKKCDKTRIFLGFWIQQPHPYYLHFLWNHAPWDLQNCKIWELYCLESLKLKSIIFSIIMQLIWQHWIFLHQTFMLIDVNFDAFQVGRFNFVLLTCTDQLAIVGSHHYLFCWLNRHSILKALLLQLHFSFQLILFQLLKTQLQLYEQRNIMPGIFS